MDRAQHRHRMRQRRIRHRHGNPKISHLHVTVLINHHVLRLDITVNDSIRMGMVNRITNLSHDA